MHQCVCILKSYTYIYLQSKVAQIRNAYQKVNLFYHVDRIYRFVRATVNSSTISTLNIRSSNVIFPYIFFFASFNLSPLFHLRANYDIEQEESSDNNIKAQYNRILFRFGRTDWLVYCAVFFIIIFCEKKI